MPDGRLSRDVEVDDRAIDRVATSGGTAVVLTFVDNAGITRLKAVPVARFRRACLDGIGISPTFAVFTAQDRIIRTQQFGGPVGDLRLVADPGAVRRFGPTERLWWCPVDQWTQDRQPFACCQRSLLKRIVSAMDGTGLRAKIGLELEWFAGRAAFSGESSRLVPAHTGPAFGAHAFWDMEPYCVDLLDALHASGIEIEQLHPEYSTGQIELSAGPLAPVEAADRHVFVRQLIRATAVRHGLQISFAPLVREESLGNGGHLHFSIWEGLSNLLEGGPGPHGMTTTGEAFVAGVLQELDGLIAFGAASAVSFLRLKPQTYSGAYACWGWENREAAVRFVAGSSGDPSGRANVEVKCFDLTANPYLLTAAVIGAGLAGVRGGLRLPAGLNVDPHDLSDSERTAAGVHRLPATLVAAADALERSSVLRDAVGSSVVEARLAVARAEAEEYGGKSASEVIEAHRWRY